MLKFRRHRAARRKAASPTLDRPDLRIGNLLDDPRLRRSMGLDAPAETARPEPRFDRRRLLDDAAA